MLDKIYKYKTMLYHYLKCRKNTENINTKISGTSNGKTMCYKNCAIFGTKVSKCIKKQEANGLLSSLRIKIVRIKKWLGIKRRVA